MDMKIFWNLLCSVETSSSIVADLPDAQIYVYEEIPRILPNDPRLQIKMKAQILESSIMATLNSKFPNRKVCQIWCQDIPLD